MTQYMGLYGIWGYTVYGAIRYMGLYGIWGYTVCEYKNTKRYKKNKKEQLKK